MKNVIDKPALVNLFNEQLTGIELDCAQYDSGNEDVIRNLAMKILAIFHNTDQSKSLISKLKLNHFLLYSGAEAYDARHLINFLGLLSLKHDAAKGWRYQAKLNHNDLKTVSQENWWSTQKIMVDSSQNSFTRARIIKAVAHLGVEDSGNGDLSRLDTSGWRIKDAGGKQIHIDPIPPTVRQMAFELLESFRDADVFKESKLHFKS